MSIYYLPFILQGVCMFFDEFIFHRSRYLPRWEQIGHPADTLSTLLTLLIPTFFSYHQFTSNVFIGLAIFSCLLITKDEFVHSKYCKPLEHWLHAVLFILHPITFICAYLMWVERKHSNFFNIQFSLISLFLIYQLLPWSKNYGFYTKSE